jgi:zinc protease
MKKSIIFAVCSLAVYFLEAQATLIEKVDPKPGTLTIPYSKYVLSNGLTLIVSEDHSDPVAHINVTYAVGSARETPGKSGFAHFFEHMLFQGSKHVADEEHFKLIKEYGGDVNGNTTRDRTVYIETFPSNFTETALWMEADRMGFFLEGFTQAKFENQRATVKNEKDERYDAPYGFLMEVKDQELYPSDHPYSWSTIGFVDDLDRADSSDLHNFFLRWYGPNNACIIVTGDVNTDEVVAWTQKYFGGIPAGKPVKKKRIKPVTLSEDKVKTVQDPNAGLPISYITYVGVPAYHEDEAALDMLTYLMGSTQSSPLYKSFINDEWALQVSASNNPLSTINHELAGEISFTLVGYPWSDMFKLRDQLKGVIDSFEWKNFTDNDLERAKKNILSSYSNGFELASSKANYISQYWYLDLKNKDNQMYNLTDDIARYQNVSRDDIMRVYRKYIKGKYSSAINVQPYRVPKGEKAEKYQSFNPNANYEGSAAMELEYQGLVKRVVKDNFERSVRPQPKEAKPVTVPTIIENKLSNGIPLLGTTFNESSRVLFMMTLEGGRLVENGKDIPWGTTQLLGMSLDQGTKSKTAEQVENALEGLGASVSFSASNTGLNIFVSCEKENLNAALDILKEMMFEPRWDEKEFKKGRKRLIESAKSNLNSRSVGLGNVWNRLRYNESPLGKYVGSDEYSKVEISHLKSYYDKYFHPGLAKAIIVGPMSESEMVASMKFLETWKSSDGTPVIQKPNVADPMATSQIFGVEYIDADQSDIIVGFRSLPYDYDGDFYKSNIMNFALGGNFNSRLNLKIREEKGWTYGIRGGYSASYKDLPGYYTVSAGVKANATDSAINEIIWMLRDFKENGLTDEEFEFTKKALLSSEALDYESLNQKAGFISNIVSRNLPKDYPQKQTQILKNISKDELNALAKKNIDLDRLMVVVSGDMLLLKKRLNKLGLGEIQVLQKDGSGKFKYLKAGKTKHIKNWN